MVKLYRVGSSEGGVVVVKSTTTIQYRGDDSSTEQADNYHGRESCRNGELYRDMKSRGSEASGGSRWVKWWIAVWYCRIGGIPY